MWQCAGVVEGMCVCMQVWASNRWIHRKQERSTCHMTDVSSCDQI